MWTTENRPRYNRDNKLRYPSDLTNEEWGYLEHLIPPAKRGGRRREVDERGARSYQAAKISWQQYLQFPPGC
jgi:hypothetical protein